MFENPTTPLGPFLRRLERPLRDPETKEMVPAGTLAVFPDPSDVRMFVPESAGNRFRQALSDVRVRELEAIVESLERTMHKNAKPTLFGRVFRLFGKSAPDEAKQENTEDEACLKLEMAKQELLIAEIESLKSQFETVAAPKKEPIEQLLREKLLKLQILNKRIKTIGENLRLATTISGTEQLNEIRKRQADMAATARKAADEAEAILVRTGDVSEAGKRLSEITLGDMNSDGNKSQTDIYAELEAAGLGSATDGGLSPTPVREAGISEGDRTFPAVAPTPELN